MIIWRAIFFRIDIWIHLDGFFSGSFAYLKLIWTEPMLCILVHRKFLWHEAHVCEARINLSLHNAHGAIFYFKSINSFEKPDNWIKSLNQFLFNEVYWRISILTMLFHFFFLFFFMYTRNGTYATHKGKHFETFSILNRIDHFWPTSKLWQSSIFLRW